MQFLPYKEGGRFSFLVSTALWDLLLHVVDLQYPDATVVNMHRTRVFRTGLMSHCI